MSDYYPVFIFLVMLLLFMCYIFKCSFMVLCDVLGVLFVILLDFFFFLKCQCLVKCYTNKIYYSKEFSGGFPWKNIIVVGNAMIKPAIYPLTF